MVLRVKRVSAVKLNQKLNPLLPISEHQLETVSQKHCLYPLKLPITAFTNDGRVISLLKDAQNSLTTSSSFKPSNKVSLQKSPGIESPHRKHFISDKRKYFHLCNTSVRHKIY